tara:strand:- start:1165 stop:1692 length:528 start_codon:yes stop_codon:yes gene_type:complete
MQNTGIDFLLTRYIDRIMVDKALVGLTANRDDIDRHLRDVSLYSVTDNFLKNGLERCEISNSKLITELAIIFDIIINNTYKLLICPDDTNFQLFVLILNSTLVCDIEEKVKQIYENKSHLTSDERREERNDITGLILERMSNNLVKDLDNSEVNPDVYTFNVRLDLNKIINSLLK